MFLIDVLISVARVYVVFHVNLRSGSLFGRLLIWEESYCEPIPRFGRQNSEVPFDDWEGCWVSPETRISELDGQAGGSIHFLVKKMMMNNQVNIVGEGYDTCIYIYFFIFLPIFRLTSL